MRVGFVGLGNMGGPMCGHLVAAGFDVTAFDLNSEALGRLIEVGARAGASVADCARGADVLITMLPAPPQVEAVLLGEGGGIAALEPGAVSIDMSTSSTAVGARIARAAAELGIDVLDAPVAGQSIGAKAGTLAIYVGGPDEVFERARPLFEAMGDPERIFHLGPHGAGYTVKLLLNLLWFIQSVAVGEVLSVGVRAGVSLDRLHGALVGSPANSVFLERDVRMVLDDGDYDEAFPMRLVTKDLGLAVDLARDVGVPVELTALVEQIQRRARALYGDDAGEISAIRLYEDLAGVKLRLGRT
ncbi:MAG TPA: NAD(P)-dependent oxidoreductase [Solirubrobacteraceae bacterium]|jgi:3-hydroxyisobutyrate dehydrogenase|nr:NAD(P)-dependent oxidoreductase [Solirubrobacteraceae bacterium]